LTGLRGSAAGRPLFRAQPELERAWRVKLEQAYAGGGTTLDASTEGVADTHLAWFLPVAGPSGAKGALALFMDATSLMEPTRRLVGALAQDVREPLIGVQVVAERLARLPKPTRERCQEDMDRVLEHARVMDRLIDDMGAFARRSSAGGGARLSTRPGDLGTIVRLACERISSGKGPPLRANVVDVQGMWDDEAIYRILSALVASARQSSESATVTVELSLAGRDGAMLSVKDDGPALRADEVDLLFEPWRRGVAPGAERRRRGVGLGLFLARELVNAHGGRVLAERPATGGFAVRVLLPISGGAAPSSRSHKTFG
jgi:signal transduction histidine kinase